MILNVLAVAIFVLATTIYPEQAEQALEIFKQLKIVDAPGSPTFGDACAEWVFDIVRSIFGAYDADSGRRLITEWFILICTHDSLLVNYLTFNTCLLHLTQPVSSVLEVCLSSTRRPKTLHQ
jgi:phage terminase large subunit-like protein